MKTYEQLTEAQRRQVDDRVRRSGGALRPVDAITVVLEQEAEDDRSPAARKAAANPNYTPADHTRPTAKKPDTGKSKKNPESKT